MREASGVLRIATCLAYCFSTMNGRKGMKRKAASIESSNSILEQLSHIGHEMLLMRQRGESGDSSKLKTLLLQASPLFLDLKSSNRESQIEVEAKKLEAQKEKQKIDQLNLSLANLIYQRNHLLKEIKRCKDFQSREKEVDLVPEEEFFQVSSYHIYEILTNA